LADLAVKKEFQKQGIGKKLVHITKCAIGNKCMLLLLSAPEAEEYYPKLGFRRVQNGFIIPRTN
jgi:predicted N-acetyltransferase YhbS